MIFATNNKGKLKEIREILSDFKIVGLNEFGVNIDVNEDQRNFYSNALKKAKKIYEITKEPTLADDSGLCITILNDWPGVMTHRFLGKEATDYERNGAIIAKMKDFDFNKREAKVVCCLVYYDGKNVISSYGNITGRICKSRRGNNGFGFDEIFELENGKTLAELTCEEKNKISARALAAEKIKLKLQNL